MYYEPVITPEDIAQEAELKRLETGKPRISQRIIQMKMQRKLSRDFPFEMFESSLDEDSGDLAEAFEAHDPSTPWSSTSCPLYVTEMLVEWALEQAVDLQDLIFDFLENPDQLLDQTVLQLRNMKIIRRQPAKPTTKTKHSFAELVLRTLPATKEELIIVVSKNAPTTERPAATVRQLLRRMIKEGRVYERAGTYYLRKSDSSD